MHLKGDVILINQNIKMLIADKSISAYEIEKKTGVSSSTIINIRNGKRSIKNLSQETGEKLNHYYLEIHKPEQVFWDEEDKTMLLSVINDDPKQHWVVSIREVRTLTDTGEVADREYPIEIKIPSYNSVLNHLVNKYWNKYDTLQNQIYADKNFPIPIQPFYVDYAQMSFINSEEMLPIIEKLRTYLKVHKTIYGDKLEEDNETVLHRTMTAFLYANTSNPDYSNCLILTLEPIPGIMSLASHQL